MSDVDKSSKTEPPTEKKLSDARSSGQFAKAPEISMTLTLLAGFIVILFYAPSKAIDIMAFTKSIIENIHKTTATQGGMAKTFELSFIMIGLVILPMISFTFVAAFVAEGLQTGFRLTPKAARPKLSKLNPVSGVKRIFGPKGLKAFLIDFLKFIFIGTVVWLTLIIFLDDPIFYAPVSIKHIPEFIYKLFIVMFAILVLMLLIIAIINFIIKKKEHDEEMKMTKQEVKEENKSKDVAPEVKTARRKKALELLSSQNLKDVGTADVVVTNPTHYAVALRYEKGMDLAPVVIAKGENLLARRIKLLAAEYEVPTIENKPVARSLYAIGKVGETIPYDFYQVVAEILAQVYKSHAYYYHRLKARRLLAKKVA